LQCRCECGHISSVFFSALRSGNSTSCGCRRRDTHAALKRTHGGSGTSEYHAWQSAKQRCDNPHHPEYLNYGARGVRMDVSWRQDFAAFLRDIGPRPSARHSLDRFPDNDGPYAPWNCRWATHREQHRNTRVNRWFTIHGDTRCLADWAKRHGMSRHVVRARVHLGWPIEKALTTPVR